MNEAIKEIRKAEENGVQLLVNAQAEAKYRVEQVVKEIKNAKETEETKLSKEYAIKSKEAQMKAEEIINSEKEQAKKDAENLGKIALENMDSAVDAIIEEIESVWQ